MAPVVKASSVHTPSAPVGGSGRRLSPSHWRQIRRGDEQSFVFTGAQFPRLQATPGNTGVRWTLYVDVFDEIDVVREKHEGVNNIHVINTPRYVCIY